MSWKKGPLNGCNVVVVICRIYVFIVLGVVIWVFSQLRLNSILIFVFFSCFSYVSYCFQFFFNWPILPKLKMVNCQSVDLSLRLTLGKINLAKLIYC